MSVIQNNIIKILTVGIQGPAGPVGNTGSQGVPFAELITTPMLPIINNYCALPREPIGDLVFNMALVFTVDVNDQFVMEEHDQVMIIKGTQNIKFLDQEYDFTGKYAVVSYLSKIL